MRRNLSIFAAVALWRSWEVHHVALRTGRHPPRENPGHRSARSLTWYERVFGFRTTVEFPDDEGVLRGVAGRMPGLGDTLVAFRENPKAAEGCRGFDPVGFAVTDRADVERWAGHLDSLDVPHSPVIDASIGWLLVFSDPDGLELHLYTWAEHGIDQSGRPGYGRPVTTGVPTSP